MISLSQCQFGIRSLKTLHTFFWIGEHQGQKRLNFHSGCYIQLIILSNPNVKRIINSNLIPQIAHQTTQTPHNFYQQKARLAVYPVCVLFVPKSRKQNCGHHAGDGRGEGENGCQPKTPEVCRLRSRYCIFLGASETLF